MIRWLEDNPLGVVLVSVCGGLLVISLLLVVIWSLPASSQWMASNSENSVPDLEVPVLAASQTIDKYDVITEHPVFRSSRLPAVEQDLDDALDEELPAEDVDAPDVQLTGIIITPSIRMATLKQEGEELSLVAFEGMPLEGNFGTWQLSRIDQREVILSSGAGEEVRLKLQVHTVAIAEPRKPDPPTEENRQGSGERIRPGDDQPMSRAEEIRQRIAERREELKRAAEENEQNAAAENPSYQQAIQAMMRPKGQDKSKNESKNRK